MALQRLLPLAFAAALTVGTCSATSTLTLGVYAHDYSTISIDGVNVFSFVGPGVYSDPLVSLINMSLPDGWHDFSVDYKSSSGNPALTIYESYSGVSVFTWDNSAILQSSVLRSLDSSGHTINGLQGSYYDSDGNPYMTYGYVNGVVQLVPLKTYGEGPIRDGFGYYNGVGSNNLWADTFTAQSHFEERFTGQIYIGTNPNPTLGTIGDELVTPPTDPGDTGSGEAPEPAGWWLVATALPLLFVSKLRLRRATA